MEKKIFTSKKNIMNIREFLQIYKGIEYNWNEKLTHRNVNVFLEEKKQATIKRVGFDMVNKEKIANGDIILVKDEAGQKIPYLNPKHISFDILMNQANQIRNEKIKKISHRKRKIEKAKLQLYRYELLKMEQEKLEREKINKEKYMTKKLNKRKRDE